MSEEDFDLWTKGNISFASLESGRAALQDPNFLEPFFKAHIAVLDAVDAADHLGLSTKSARALPTFGVNVLLVGEAGAGKSTLIKVMTGDENVFTSSTHAGTICDERFSSPCKISWIDTPGFKLPISPEDATQSKQGWFAKWKDSFMWKRWLAKIKYMMTAPDLTVRPSAVIYCHRASSRVIPDRMMEIFELPHAHQVPLIVCITDVCGVGDDQRKDQRRAMADIVDALGPNGVGRRAALIEINSEAKTVRGHKFAVTGVKDLLEAVINALDPNFAMQLVHRANWLRPGVKRPKPTRNIPAPPPRPAPVDRQPLSDSSEEESEEEAAGGGGEAAAPNGRAAGRAASGAPNSAGRDKKRSRSSGQ